MATGAEKEEGNVGGDESGPEIIYRDAVKKALDSLHDLPALSKSPLVFLQPEQFNLERIELARLLKKRLLDAIENLRPETDRGEKAARPHNAVRLRYVEGYSPTQARGLLGIGNRTFYTYFNAGLEAIAEYLKEELKPAPPVPLSIHPGGQTPLVGRDWEVSQMRAAFDSAASADGGSVVMLSGDQGIGKTRLAHELGEYVRGKGGLFLEGRWAEWEGLGPYGAVAEALRQGLRTLDTDEMEVAVGPYRQDLARLFPQIASTATVNSDGIDPSTEDQQLRLFEGVCSFLSYLTEKQPVVLFLDDLHLCPQMDLQLYIARRLPEYRLLIVYAFREDELVGSEDLVKGRNELVRAHLVTSLRLSPLTEEETLLMIANAFGKDAAEQLRELAFDNNPGNPFFIEEVLRYLQENNIVVEVDGRWEVLNTDGMVIPESVKLLIQERMARLGDEATEILQQAAVLGKEFSFGALSMMSDQDESRVVELLDDVISASFLIADEGRWTAENYSFKEDHVREVVYGIIPIARRHRFHRQAGKAMERLYPDRLDELAYHFTHGGDVLLGAHYSFLAAERESSVFNWSRAITLYKGALDLWNGTGNHVEERATVAEKLGDACYQFGIESHRAVGYFNQALKLNQQLGIKHKVATIYSKLGREHMHSGNLGVQNLDLALEHFNAALEIFDHEAEGIPRGMVYCGVAMAHQDRLELDDAASWAGQGVELGEHLHAAPIIANASASLGSALAHRNILQGKEALERGWVESIQGRLGFQADLSRASGARAFGVVLKDPNTGFDWIGRVPDYRTTYSLLDIPSHLVALHTLKGEFDKARQRLEDVQTYLRVLGQSRFGPWPDELAILWIREGQWNRAETRLKEALDWASGSHNLEVAASTSQKLGEVYLAMDQLADAERYLLLSTDLIGDTGSTAHRLTLLPHICELYLKTDRAAEAERFLKETLESVQNIGEWEALTGDVLLANGLVLAAKGNHDSAAANFKDASGIYQDYDLPWDQAKTYFEWANAISMNGNGKADEDLKRSLLGSALELWDGMGAQRHAELCRSQLA